MLKEICSIHCPKDYVVIASVALRGLFPSQKSNRFLYEISVYEFVNTSKQNERQTNSIF